MSATIAELTAEIVQWADKAFPKRYAQVAFLKMFEEMGELVGNPRGEEEYADVCIMMFDLANMHGVDLAAAIRNKMAINRNRTWAATESGTFQHVEPANTERISKTEWQDAPKCNVELPDGSRCQLLPTAACEHCI